MNPLAVSAVGGIIGTIGNVIDDLVATDAERMSAQIELSKIDASLLTAQMEVNKAEASHASIWVAGWRPGVGWVALPRWLTSFWFTPCWSGAGHCCKPMAGFQEPWRILPCWTPMRCGSFCLACLALLGHVPLRR